MSRKEKNYPFKSGILIKVNLKKKIKIKKINK